MIPLGKVELCDGWMLFYPNGGAYVTHGGSLSCVRLIDFGHDWRPPYGVLGLRRLSYRTDRVGD